MGWHWGSWWPIFVLDYYGPRCSQHVFDPYSFTHILHGFVFYLLWGSWPPFVSAPWWWNFVGGPLLALFCEFLWEVFENSQAVMKRFRENSGTSSDYQGDSIQNIIGDILCAFVGYWICILSVEFHAFCIIIVWFIFSELLLAYCIHDSLILIWVQLACPSKKIKSWQLDAVEGHHGKRKKNSTEDTEVLQLVKPK